MRLSWLKVSTFAFLSPISSFVTYLERDIKDLSQVGKLNEFYDFLVYIAARTGQELKYDKISKQIGVSAPTKNHG